ncbi:alpha/beta fold hydrolase [Actinoallomurus purpureus]|uniref:alpha/beta fold hydrolase n=1 Tax=Actinoallomurus purpureus TaxID=478114 RepID=UPI002092B9B5|nr:alpha/beta fold hydrolase [Actinoallomurus purpureus]MCO6003898.1 alpha/beta fold hydrolase [Actinoallomurus purpureus]
MDIVFERRGDGPPLLLMHGIGHRWQAWEPVIDLLAEERDVIAVDLPGFGASPPLPPGTPYDLDTVVSLLSEFIDRLGLDRPNVAGNSLGGLFALEAADRGLARSVTALSPAGFYTPVELRYAALALRACRLGAGVPASTMRRLARSPRMRALMFGMIYGRPDLIAIDTLLDDAAALRGAAGFEPTLRAGRETTFRGSVQDVPVTIAWGTHDRLLRSRQAIRAQQALPHARFVWLQDCGHVPMADDPHLVARVLLEGSADRPRPGAVSRDGAGLGGQIP